MDRIRSDFDPLRCSMIHFSSAAYEAANVVRSDETTGRGFSPET